MRSDLADDVLEIAPEDATVVAVAPWHDHRAGTIMRAVAVFGVVVSIVATIAIWEVLSNLERSVRDSLQVGEDATATLSDTIDVADALIDTVDDGLATIDSSLDTFDAAIDDTADLATTTASLADTLPASFDGIDAALATVESLSATIDTALTAASRVPFGPDYDPEVPLPAAVGGLRDALEPIGGDLRAIADELGSFADNSDDLRGQISALSDDLATARAAVADSDALLDEYRTRAADARAVVVTGQDDLSRSIRAARLATILIGLLIATGQYLPWWLGTRLRAVPISR